jgi:hypothetical protein
MNRLEHPLDVLQHVAVPEAQDPIAAQFEPSRARPVVGDVLAMLAAVDLDQQPMRQACKIDDVGSDRHLTAKAIAADLTISQLPPQLALRVGEVVSKLPGPSRSHASRLSAISGAVATPHPTLPLKGGGIWVPSQVNGYGQALSAV